MTPISSIPVSIEKKHHQFPSLKNIHHYFFDNNENAANVVLMNNRPDGWLVGVIIGIFRHLAQRKIKIHYILEKSS